MIIAKPEWFKRRKYGGWGADVKTWQGAVYVIGIFSLLIALQLIPNLSIGDRLLITGVWLVFLFVDSIDVMWQLKKDEREYIHEAVAERNAAGGMMTILSIGIFAELIYNALQQRIYVDPFLIAAVVAGILIKSITNYKLEKES